MSALRYGILAAAFCLAACAYQSPVSFGPKEWIQKFVSVYDQYKESSLTDRRFKHSDIVPLLKGLPAEDFTVEVAGSSLENRDLYRVTWGQGPVDVLLWSQMHGDEPTATAALFDIFNFLQAENDGFDSLRQSWQQQLTLTFLPMVNPDGADRNQRRTALGIDLNRDADRLMTPEAQFLKAERDRLDADWGFNLHDQSRYYSAGYPSEKLATITFLAPAYDYEESVNEIRGEAMQLIVMLNSGLQPLIPGQVAKWNDSFEPRAFGENMQKWGTRTVLVESGGYFGDREKQEIRKLNFATLLTGFGAIASRGFEPFDREAYRYIPLNESNGFFDLLVRRITIEEKGREFTLDVGYRSSEVDFSGNRRYYLRSAIGDVGDLSIFGGYEVLEEQGLRARIGKKYPQAVSAAQLRQLDPEQLYRQGYTAVEVSDWSAGLAATYDRLHLLRSGERLHGNVLPGLNPDLLLYDGNTLKFAVINGQLITI